VKTARLGFLTERGSAFSVRTHCELSTPTAVTINADAVGNFPVSDAPQAIAIFSFFLTTKAREQGLAFLLILVGAPIERLVTHTSKSMAPETF
jgi:hypothetical protein